MKEFLQTRKHNGEEYKFYRDSARNVEHIVVETPENCFGYPDIVIKHQGKKPYTLHRYLQPSILKKLEKQMLALEEKYCNTGVNV